VGSEGKDPYTIAGINYSKMDPFKRLAQRAALGTEACLEKRSVTGARIRGRPLTWTRGESTYLIMLDDENVIAHTEEGLGTKNLVADNMYVRTGKSHYDDIAQDAVAMIVNDMITLGVLPMAIAQHIAVGSSDWFDQETRCADLVRGWAQACRVAECVWSGGETPTLPDVVEPGRAVISGSAWGYGSLRQVFEPSSITNRDAIIMLASSGIHANGLTLARHIADDLPEKFLTKLEDGRTYGEALLTPTTIYVPFIRECLDRKIRIHYAVNITGHGWTKLMRAADPHAYVITEVPTPQPEFTFIQQHVSMNDADAYKIFNMGAGFAVYVEQTDVTRVLTAAKAVGIKAWQAGYITSATTSRVEIKPRNITYTADMLQVR